MSASSALRPLPSADFWTGVNYWPANSAMYWWSRFNLDAAQADLARIAAEGFRYLRFFLLWETFQPEPTSVSAAALSDLERFANAAERAGLHLQPTLFTGHMSGANWLPEFATQPADGSATRFLTVVSGKARPLRAADLFAEERLVRAQELLAREVARVLARHPAMWSWDLGNEHSNVAMPSTRDEGRRWLARIVEALRAGGSLHPVTIGLHMEDLEEDRRLGPGEAAEVCDYLSMHGYPLYSTWARHQLDASLLPFLGLVTEWLGGGRPVLFQEFGLPTRGCADAKALGRGDSATRGGGEPGGEIPVFDDAQGAAFYREALAELRREAFLGAFAWCAFDYAEDLWMQPPLDEKVHERFFGLFRADGSPKPAINPWRELHRGLLERANEPRPGRLWIDLDQEQFWAAPATELRRLYARFVKL
jgi:endo-1,4-beta-mannosidase